MCEFFDELHEFMGSYAAAVPPYLSDVLSRDSGDDDVILTSGVHTTSFVAPSGEVVCPTRSNKRKQPALPKRNEPALNEDFLGAVVTIAKETLDLQRSELEFKRRCFEEENRLCLKKMELEQEQFFKQVELKCKAKAHKTNSKQKETSG